MEDKKSKQLIITAVRGSCVLQIAGPFIPEIASSQRAKLKSQYKGWTLQLRTPEGFKHIKILAKGLPTKNK